MKNILIISFIICLALTGILIITMPKAKVSTYNTILNNGDIINEDIEQEINNSKILKVQLSNEEGMMFDDYEYYTYYYFENDILIKEEIVYIFEDDKLANRYYMQLQDKEKYSMCENILAINMINSEYYGYTYDDVLNLIKNDWRVIGYTQEQNTLKM